MVMSFGKLQGQTRCEFDTLYPSTIGWYGNGGLNVIQLNDGNFIISGFAIRIRTITEPHYYQPMIVKMDVCGNIIWKFIDSIPYTNTPSSHDFIEEEDNSITFHMTGEHLIKFDSFGTTTDENLIKIDRNGNKKWKIRVGNDSDVMNTSFIKFAANKYLYAGRKYGTLNTSKACLLMTDSIGNTIFQNYYYIDSNSNSYISKIYRKSLNEIILIGFEDSCIMSITIDSIGTVKNIFKKYIQDSISSIYKVKNVFYNTAFNEILFTSAHSKLFIARCDLSGNIIKDTLFNFGGSFFSPGPNKSIIMGTSGNINLMDSNFTIIKSVPILNTTLHIYQSIYSQDSAILSIGYSFEGIIGYKLFAKKTFLYKYVQSISINGPNLISTKGGQIQLTAAITPADAAYQQINWSVNDTNKANITQSGLLTAKANGTVIVTAISIDNSLATASKTITITNQQKYITAIVINGLNFIDQNKGQIQLTTSITPTDAFNKKIKWSVNDTSKVSIDSTGLVIAKANGTVVVTASATDSSNVTTTKSISITNQIKLIQSIIIYGPNSISQNGGQIQSTTIITPTDATNQKINWSVNDTIKASIDSTGLLRAKTNGTVIITASSSDGSNVTATKSISITNQGAGINENDPGLFVYVFPNPASQSLSVSLQGNYSGVQFEFFDAKGQLIKNIQFDKINEQLYTLDIKDLADGMYLISVRINESKIYRKVMVVK